MRNFILCCVIGLLEMATGNARGAVILQNTGDFAIQVDYYEPVAQSFTAEDPLIVFAFNFNDFNVTSPNDPLQLRLLEGDGLGGSVLAMVGFSVPLAFDGFYDVSLSSVTLTPGNVYTAELTVPGDSPYWGVRLNDDGNPYPGGRAYFAEQEGNITPDAADDMRFRVTPIPEPSGLVGGLLLLGLGLCCRRCRAR